MMEMSCSGKIKEALYNCAETLIRCNDVDEKLALAQAIETLSRSLSILEEIKGKEDEE